MREGSTNGKAVLLFFSFAVATKRLINVLPFQFYFTFDTILYILIQSAMDPGHEYGIKMMGAQESDVVKFKFCSQEGKVVRSMKSFLSNRSPVFATQFSKTWDDDTVDIDDLVSFDQHQQFSLFIQVLSGLTEMVQISVYEAACLYFYAEKYQIDDLKTKLIDTLPKLVKPSSDSDLKLCLEFVTEHNFSAMLDAVDGVQLEVSAKNGLNFFGICSKFKMEKLMFQVVEFKRTLEYDDSWPPNLLRRIAEKNWKDFKDSVKASDDLRNDFARCRHKIYTMASNCEINNYDNCKTKWNEISKFSKI